MRIWALLCIICLFPALLFAQPAPPVTSEVISLTWKQNVEADFDRYKLYQKKGSAAWGVVKELSVTSYEIPVSSLVYNEMYAWAVSAVDKNGNESAKSEIVSKKITGDVVIPSPSQFTVIQVAGMINLSWVLPLNAEAGLLKIWPDGIEPVSCAMMTLCQDNIASQAWSINLSPGRYIATIQGIGLTNVVGRSASLTIDVPQVSNVQGLIVSDASALQVMVEADVVNCPKLSTSTAGSTSLKLRRTIKCMKP